MSHDVPAKMAARVREAVREFARFRQEQQPHDVIDERRQDDDLRLDGVVGIVGTVIRHAGHAPAVVAVDPVAHGAGDQLEIAGGFGFRNFRHQHRGLCADVAAVRRAEAAISAARSTLVGLRQNGARRRERMVAELRGAFFEDASRVVDEQGAVTETRAAGEPRRRCHLRSFVPAGFPPCRKRPDRTRLDRR